MDSLSLRHIRWLPAVLGTILLGNTLLASPTLATPQNTAPQNTASQNATPQAQWIQRWSPQAAKDGLGAFEGVEDHGKTKEIYVQGNNYRFDMLTTDRDGSDRQRNEVKGMVTAGQQLTIGKGDTWRFTYSMYIPSTLRATTSFTHIMQMKEPGLGSAPIVTLDLRRRGSASSLELVVNKTNTVVGGTDLLPLQNKWISIDVSFRYDNAPNGTAHFIVNDGTRNVVDAQKSGVDTWLADRVRPKWGIYRSINDKADLLNTYLLLTNLKAYQLS
ncbi:Tat pathway signal sequence domain protein [Solihabitans fulvus]|uniref:Tat pathway signal sequence domain protein n=1 Tax=Solihabitans fulvus TaxID=1892852 RepID=A0A5B2X494_9PSEU|nr:Tat pathway signal sequence domain protein [Solihabitans fulvus]KAA2258023.1 Tat pathway signal sequence domain protein [Solihabitans fulvus]